MCPVIDMNGIRYYWLKCSHSLFYFKSEAHGWHDPQLNSPHHSEVKEFGIRNELKGEDGLVPIFDSSAEEVLSVVFHRQKSLIAISLKDGNMQM